jgi:hypothetical protein
VRGVIRRVESFVGSLGVKRKREGERKSEVEGGEGKRKGG